MGPDSTIRELRSSEELRGCVDLLRTAFGTVAAQFGLTQESAPTNAAFTTLENLRRHLQSGMRLYGMFLGASLVGCVAIKKSKADDAVYYVERLAVTPARRHLGFGRQLVQHALETIRGLGGRTASIGIIEDNEMLRAWYLAQGFVQHDSRRIEHLPFKVCFMSADLAKDGGYSLREE